MVIWRRVGVSSDNYKGLQFVIWENNSLRGELIDGTRAWLMETVSPEYRDNMMNENIFWSKTDLFGYAERMEEGSRCNT